MVTLLIDKLGNTEILATSEAYVSYCKYSDVLYIHVTVHRNRYIIK